MEMRTKPTDALGPSQETETLEAAKRDNSTINLPTEAQASNLDTINPLPDNTSNLARVEAQGARLESSGHQKNKLVQVGNPSEARRKTSIEPHEAIRRGLSFGPLRKNVGRHNSSAGILKTSSKSPSSRLNQSQRSLSSSSDILSSAGVGRLKKDHYVDDLDREVAIDSSDDDPQAWSSGDEALDSVKVRGREREVKESDRTTPSSPLTASEERPAVTVTAPEGEKPVSTSKKFIVRPSTNYDRNVSRGPSPSTSDSEELNDIRRAQKLKIKTSPIDSSIPHRVIQTIIRGDFAQMQKEAEEGTRRLRTYLVATDLSGEAAYALEWTIGTVLRDGDTLLAVYAVDEEIGTGVTGDSLPIGEGAKAIQDTTAVMEKMTVASQKGPLMLTKASLLPGSRRSSAAASADSRSRSNAKQERTHAIERLSETCLRFLRKTKLQVRLAIEVIHCKSPKYMVTEAVRHSSRSRKFFQWGSRFYRLMGSNLHLSSLVLVDAVLSKGKPNNVQYKP